MAISGDLELLSMSVPEQQAIIEKVRQVNTQVRRLSEITGKLMATTHCETKMYLDTFRC
jgi:hypothetical protein